MKGNWGKILLVDLEKGSTGEIKLSEKLYRDFLGGSGLAAKWFFDNECWKVDPLSPENPLIFMLGPLSASNLPGAARLEICAKSPLTKIWGEACMGGFFAPQLRATGYDGIIINGASDKPVYLYVTDKSVEIKDAMHLWGKDTYETEDLLKEELGDKRAQVACIGPAGENKVRYACIMNHRGSTAGRCGMGAVMGSKKLKAVVVRGKKKMEFANPDKVKEIGKKMHEALRANVIVEGLGSYGTSVWMEFGMAVGDTPVKNWRVASWSKGPENLGGVAVAEKILTSHHGCHGCPVGCKRVVKVKSGPYAMEEGPGAEYEGAGAVGSLLLIDSVEANNKANELTNRYGMDVISAGSTIAYATEAFERGLITARDTGGVALNWGNPELLMELLRKIAYREGFGDILADGSRAASEKFGGSEFAIHVKGLECPMHDPRALWGMALTYATSIRGACHCADSNLFIEPGLASHKDLGVKSAVPYKAAGRAEVTIASQKKGNLSNSAVICEYVESLTNNFDEIVEVINAVTGFDYTKDELARVGDRIWYIKRAIGNLCGATREHDRLPKRILEPHPEGSASNMLALLYPALKMLDPLKSIRNKKILDTLGVLMNNIAFPMLNRILVVVKYSMPWYWTRRIKLKLKDPKALKRATVPFDEMLNDYYRLRDIDEKGRPSRERLESIGLDDVARVLHAG